VDRRLILCGQTPSLGGQRLSLGGQRLSLGGQRPNVGDQKAHPFVQEAAATPWRSWRVSAEQGTL